MSFIYMETGLFKYSATLVTPQKSWSTQAFATLDHHVSGP